MSKKYHKNNYLKETLIGLNEKLYSFSELDTAQRVILNSPKKKKIEEVILLLLDILVPGYNRSCPNSMSSLRQYFEKNLLLANKILAAEIKKALPFIWLAESSQKKNIPPIKSVNKHTKAILEKFFLKIPEIRSQVIEDITAAYRGDPAALSYAEIKICYPGILAICTHRLAHELYALQVPIIPRIISEWSHSQTGADIHPGAQIADGFFIDHCTGVVIGETSIIGKNVKIYQGATLGAKSFALDENGQPIKSIKRHPTVLDNVIIYANATILGGNTVIGKSSTIGAGAFVMESVPDNTVVTANRSVDNQSSKLVDKKI